MTRPKRIIPRSYKTASFTDLFPTEIETVVGYSLNGDDWRFERWDLVPGTLLVNRRNKTIRFQFNAVGGDDPGPYEAIIRDAGDGWVFKADDWGEPETEYPLHCFESPNSILFVLNGKISHLYLHVEKEV